MRRSGTIELLNSAWARLTKTRAVIAVGGRMDKKHFYPVEVDELPDAQRSQPVNPDFRNVWTLAEERSVDWDAVSKAWSGAAPARLPEEE